LADNVQIYKILLEIKEEQGEQRGILNRVLAESQKTNGRVTECEKRIDGLEKVHDYEKGKKKVKSKKEQRRWEVLRYGIYVAIGAGISKVIDLFSGK